MLSPVVLKAVALIKSIQHDYSLESNCTLNLSDSEVRRLLRRLSMAELIRLKDKDCDASKITSYEVCHSLYEISLCDILVATGGGIELSIKDTQDIYSRYGLVAPRLDVINHMMCHFLSDIHVTDL